MAIILFDNTSREGLYPLSLTKAVADLRFGILSIRERWERRTGQPVFIHTASYLQPLYDLPPAGEHLWIDASIMADEGLRQAILALEAGTALEDEKGLIAAKTETDPQYFDIENLDSAVKTARRHPSVKRLEHPWQCMQWNDTLIREDFTLVTKGRISGNLSSTVNMINAPDIFIEEGVRMEFCTLNAATGPIYIGRNAEVMEGSAIRGPFAMGENAVLKLNSRVYGATTLGPSCMGGGEIKNTVMMGYSNKAHDGYLGDSVIGEWCNFGAGSTNSNVKNTAGPVKIWDMATQQYQQAGQKCGVIMGDHSRAAINSCINTGSMIGVSCNVFGAGLLPTIVPNFSWGVDGTKYEFSKAIQAISNWKKMKGHSLSDAETSVLAYIFER